MIILETLKLGLVLVVVASMLGCGTIIHGSQQDVSISAPNNALVRVGNKVVQGSTTLKLDRDKSYSVVMEKDGKTYPCGQINKSISGGLLLVDILILFPEGFIDALTGGWNNLEPTQVICQGN